MREDFTEFTGYLVSITPRTRRGLVEYKLKLMSPGGESITIYTSKPPLFLRPGLYVKVRAILSRQLETPRWVVDEMKIVRGARGLEPVPAVIEEVTRGVYPIVSGRKENEMFSVPAEEEVLAKIPADLPQRFYCLFAERGVELKLVEVLKEEEYQLFRKTLSMLSEIDEDSRRSEMIVKEYFKKSEPPSSSK